MRHDLGATLAPGLVACLAIGRCRCYTRDGRPDIAWREPSLDAALDVRTGVYGRPAVLCYTGRQSRRQCRGDL